MTLNIGVLMDPIDQIKVKKDSTFAMMLAAQARGWNIYYFEQRHLFLKDQVLQAHMQLITVKDDPNNYYQFNKAITQPLQALDVVLMRKDPPFDIEYIYTTHLLELAQQQGVTVINKPQALRDYNEKLATTWFPQCCPPTLVTRDATLLREFLQQHQDVIFKPLEGMGGSSVFRVGISDPNVNVIIENLTQSGMKYIIGQQFVPEIIKGDKRILLIDGEPIPYALARIPPPGDTRGNLAAGAIGQGVALTTRDLWICQQVAPMLRAKGLVFVGIDVIGDYLTEINITSPTCIRELDTMYQLNIADQLMEKIITIVKKKRS